jgi:hypothetical protein
MITATLPGSYRGLPLLAWLEGSIPGIVSLVLPISALHFSSAIPLELLQLGYAEYSMKSAHSK